MKYIFKSNESVFILRINKIYNIIKVQSLVNFINELDQYILLLYINNIRNVTK